MEVTPLNHVRSFNVVNTVEQANEATREIFDKIATENLNSFEGLFLRNSFIASEDYTGGLDNTVAPVTVSQSNPAGSFRSLLTPKGDAKPMTAISNLGEVSFEKFGTDDIRLEIDEYITTPFKLLYSIDGAQGSGWLVDGLESALTQQFTSAIIRHNNWKIYNTIKNGAVAQTDNKRGVAGRVLVTPANETAEQFTFELIDAIADYGVLPEDRYVSGFDENELVVAISYKGHAKLLKEKLVIYDGQDMGIDGKFYQGMPYTHTFAGANLFRTKWLNDGINPVEAEYVITPIGKYAPLLFHLARFAGRAEVAPFTDGAISAYGTLLTGMKVEPKLDQHITLKVTSATKPATYKGNFTNMKALKTNAGEISITGKLEGQDGEYAIYEADNGTQILAPTAIVAGDIDLSQTGLTSGKMYHIVFASGTIANPETLTVNGVAKPYVGHLYVRA